MNNLLINAFEIDGNTLKKLIFINEGVLIHEGEWVTFIPSPQTKVTTQRINTYVAKTKTVFSSKDFDRIRQLSDNEEYIVWIAKDIINIHKAKTYEFVMSLNGKTF